MNPTTLLKFLPTLKTISPLFIVLLFTVYQNISETRWIFGINTIPSLQNELTEERINNNLADSNITILKQTIERQNLAINGFIAHENRLKESLAIIEAESEEKIKVILQRNTGTTAEEAIDYLFEIAPSLK